MKDSRSTVFVKANSGDDIAGVERLNFDDLILLPQMGNVDGLVNDDAAARLAFSMCGHPGARCVSATAPASAAALVSSASASGGCVATTAPW